VLEAFAAIYLPILYKCFRLSVIITSIFISCFENNFLSPNRSHSLKSSLHAMPHLPRWLFGPRSFLSKHIFPLECSCLKVRVALGVWSIWMWAKRD